MAGLPTALPTSIADGIWTGAQSKSAILAVANARPQRFGNMTKMVLTTRPKAEIVGSGAQKSANGGALTNVTAAPIKAQVGLRFDEELQWADEQDQLNAMNDLGVALQNALAEQIDLAVIHRVSALQGTVVAAIPSGLVTAGAEVEMNLKTAGTNASTYLTQAAGVVLGAGYTPNGAVLDSTFAFQVASATDTSGRPIDAAFPLNGAIDNYRGLRMGVSPSVSGKNVMADSKLRAVVGDYNALGFGLMKEIPIRKYDQGDPDGQGDLGRFNQILLRAELVFGFAIFDTNAFARVVDKVVDA